MLFIFEMFILGIAAGLISGALGLGGGVVMVPAFLAFVSWMDVHTAKGTSLFIIAFVSATNAWRLGKRLEVVPWSLVGKLATGSIVGGYLGAWITTFASERVILGLYLALVCTIAWRLFHTANVAEVQRSAAPRWWFPPLLGAFSGAAGGATGTGGGLILVPLALQTGLATNKNATAISNMVMVLVAAMGTIAHLRAVPTLSVAWTVGHINFQVVPAVFIGAQLGSAIGRHYDHRLSLRARRIVLGTLLLLIVASLLPRMV